MPPLRQRILTWLPGIRTSDPEAAVRPERRQELLGLERRLGYRFRDHSILERALTHRSFLHDAENQRDEVGDYESMEFFGDAVLGLVISEALYRAQPHLPEGELSKRKAHLVSSRQLSKISRELGLADFIRLSKGEEKTGGREKRAILADIFESLTAAIYLDGGLEAVRRFLLSRFQPLLDEFSASNVQYRDFKSALQEELHRRGESEPHYLIVGESGPDHCKSFAVEVVAAGRPLAQGSGGSKKEAEQRAARSALEALLPDKK